MDRRQRKTRQAIFEAFGKLLNRKKFNHITVQEIIDEANIGRSTFYAHFETKEELLRAMCDDIFAHVFSEELTKEADHDFSGAPQDLKRYLTHILYHLQEKKENIRGLLTSESGEVFLGYLKQYMADVFRRSGVYRERGIPEDYVLAMLVSSFAETVRWWIVGHAEYTPEEMAGYFTKCSIIEIL